MLFNSNSFYTLFTSLSYVNQTPLNIPIIIILLGVLSVLYPYLTGEKTINPVEYEQETAFVTRVIDGDTLVCNNETIRLLGIDNKEVVSI